MSERWSVQSSVCLCESEREESMHLIICLIMSSLSYYRTVYYSLTDHRLPCTEGDTVPCAEGDTKPEGWNTSGC